jgi:hypothetical protein
LVHLQAKSGDFEGALKTASEMRNKFSWYAECRQTIAKFQTSAGQPAVVREGIRKESDPLIKAYLLVGMAEGIQEAAERAKSR